MQSVEVRGVVVYVEPKGEVNRRIGLYTEEGMLYFNLFGAKSSKGHSKSAIGLFTMGIFYFTLGAKALHKFVDVKVYEFCRTLAHNLSAYYAASAAAELVRHTIGADHTQQFKFLVSLLRFLNKNKHLALCTTIIFLWRSLCCNGWQPKIETMRDIQGLGADSLKMFYTTQEGFVGYAGQAQVNSMLIPYTLMKELQDNSFSFSEMCMRVEDYGEKDKQILLSILFNIWNDTLGYKLILSDFMID